jgi:hypothetical protein
VNVHRDLSDEQRSLVAARKGFDSGDLFQLEWDNTDSEGRRIGSCELRRSRTRLAVAGELTTQSFIAALQADEVRVRAVPIRTFTGVNNHFATV